MNVTERVIPVRTVDTRSPFVRLAELLADVKPGQPPISIAVGEPQHPVPPFVGPVLAAHIADFGRYPANTGTEGFRRAVAGWLGSYGGEDSASDISRGLWAGSHGTRRMLKLFDKYNIKATWFIPGHTLETFPEECAMVRDAGHEIGLHGMHCFPQPIYKGQMSSFIPRVLP